MNHIHIGDFQGCANGSGDAYYVDGNILRGNWVDGNLHGDGVAEFPTLGCWMIGNWKNGKENGEFIQFKNNGESSYLLYSDGKLIGTRARNW